MVVARPSKLEEAYFHENTVADKSLTFFLQPLLDQISLRLPAWISPNLITMCAGFLIISMAALFILHLPDMHGPVSAWMCAVGIIGVLGFVLLDNLDGRHAKNTGMCSKLGDFLDHGIDSFADPLAVLTIGLVMQGGVSLPIWQFLLSIVLVCFMNYIYLWSDKHTKVCFVSDVQLEAYIFFSIIFAITGLFGEKVWLYDLSSLLPSQGQEMIPHTVPLGMVLIMLALLLPITEYYDSFSRVIKVAGSFSPFIELLPPAMLAVGLVLWGTFSPSHICENQRLEISLLAISLFSLVTGRYNLARLTGEKVTLGWECYAFLVMATAISILKIDDSMILPLSVVIATLDAIHFYCSTTMEIASILHVPIFGMKQATKVKVNPVKVVETKEDLAMVACGLNTSPTMR